MARITLPELNAIIASYVDAAKQAGTWSASTNNLAALVDKIAKVITIDGQFQDKLGALDGEELPLGKTIEEFYQDLCPILDYSDGTSDSSSAQLALKPYYPSYEDTVYNYTLGKKVIPTTIKYNDYERACNSPEELSLITSMVLKRLYDTYAVFKYDAKKQLIANAIAKMGAVMDASTATAYVDATTDIVKGTRYKQSSVVGICVKAKTHATGDTWAKLISGGYIILPALTSTLAIPEDDSTGEAFIADVKKKVEMAEFVSEGNSLNPATIGASEGLLLIIKKGIKPILDVATMAGAFNPERLAIPAEVIVVDDFGNDSSKAYAFLCDRRALRLHPTYNAVREQLNAGGDFVNYFLHTENTAFISKNCFIHVWQDD